MFSGLHHGFSYQKSYSFVDPKRNINNSNEKKRRRWDITDTVSLSMYKNKSITYIFLERYICKINQYTVAE